MGSGRLNRLAAVAANTFREARRERVFYNLLVFAILMTLCGLLLAKLSIRQHEKIIKDVGLASMDVFGTLIALFMGVGLVRKEIERRSLLALLAKPLQRDELFLGKFAGLAMTLLANLGVMTAGLFLTLWGSGAKPDLRLLGAVYPIYLSLLLVVALALLFSTLASSTTTAAVVTFCLVAAGRFSDVIRDVRTVAPAVPAWLAEAFYCVIPNFRNFDFKDRVAYGDAVPLAALAWTTIYAIVYLGVVLGAGMAAFRSTELR